jgi:AcrR family transcriptional regulator
MADPAYTRLDVDERRRQLLELGEELFTRYAFDEISMAAIAREAGISKALLYHYFPSKLDYFVATLANGATDLAARVESHAALPPSEALTNSIDEFLAWIEEHSDSYAKLIQSVGTVPEVREMVEGIRRSTAQRILDGVSGDEPPPPAARTAVAAWLWFMDGAILDWLEHRDLERAELLGLLLGTLLGALTAAGAAPLGQNLSASP